jgi:hypothetical protein
MWADILTWIRNNSAVVPSIVTAAATVVIAIAAIVGTRIIRLEKKRQKADRMPVLVLTEEIELHETTQSRALYVKNIGYGPALNVVRKIIEMQLVVGSLGPGDKTFALYRSAREIPILDNPNFRVAIECDDILDQHFEFIYENRRLLGPKRISKRKMLSSDSNRS